VSRLLHRRRLLHRLQTDRSACLDRVVARRPPHPVQTTLIQAPDSPLLRCGRFELTLERPLVMGVLNLTPDSFSDGGRWPDADAAIAHAMAMIDDGVDLLDLGAESTRPGAPTVPADLELSRLAPVIRALAGCGRPLSVDTRKPQVMRAVLDLGVDMINDVSGFADPQAIAAVSASQAACCVMHMLGQPLTMQQDPVYRDVVSEVCQMLADRAAALQSAGIERSRIVIDPGIGFGKTLEHNLALLADLPRLGALGWPVLVGVSRKSMLGALTGRAVDRRLPASLAAMLAAVVGGAQIVRVHDVPETVDALRVWRAIQDSHRLTGDTIGQR
jgi:dihydropteroate synthase